MIGDRNMWSKSRRSLHERSFFHILMLILLVATFGVSLTALLKINKLSELTPDTIDIEAFLSGLTAHEELSNFADVTPLNLVQITTSNLGNLQTQITGLDTSYIGNFLVQYPDAIVIYDYNSDMIKGTVRLQQQLPADFFPKLLAHPELEGLEAEQPIGSQIDQTSLASLKQQFPEIYGDAEVRDFLLQYPDQLVIYNYINDEIVNVVDLEQN